MALPLPPPRLDCVVLLLTKMVIDIAVVLQISDDSHELALGQSPQLHFKYG
jgi:hypothetical protein